MLDVGCLTSKKIKLAFLNKVIYYFCHKISDSEKNWESVHNIMKLLRKNVSLGNVSGYGLL